MRCDAHWSYQTHIFIDIVSNTKRTDRNNWRFEFMCKHKKTITKEIFIDDNVKLLIGAVN